MTYEDIGVFIFESAVFLFLTVLAPPTGYSIQMNWSGGSNHLYIAESCCQLVFLALWHGPVFVHGNLMVEVIDEDMELYF